ncbi:MAG: hypothetical protein HRT71_15615 [Flavobacteriales bacterium]|nr:hypothetical protein [Flavobacteriales bacterium]
MKKRIFRFIKNLIRDQKVKQMKDVPRLDVEQKHIENIKILLNRQELLKHLPKNGVVAELGVYKGGFSQEILEICKPSKLHLVDTWATSSYPEGKG